MRIAVLIFCGLAAYSCHSKKSSQNVRFETTSMLRETGDCQGKSRACALVDFNFPLAKSDNSILTEAINRQILLDLNDEFGDAPLSPDLKFLEKSVSDFLSDWKAEDEANRRNGGEGEQGWEISVSGDLRMQTPKVAAISMSHYSYTGGAYPNSYVRVYNFDLKTGQPLSWSNVVTDLEEVKKIAEQKFRDARQISADANLADLGFFRNEPFFLGNFELQPDGIYCFYNPYDAANYASGLTDFVLTYKELGKLFKRDAVF